jgi:hypothetical protein
MKGRLLKILGALLVSLVIVGLCALSYYLPKLLGEPATYKGQVISKHSQRRELEFGSRLVCYLLIETQAGQRIQVRVSPAIYERAEAWMRIEKTTAFNGSVLSAQPE